MGDGGKNEVSEHPRVFVGSANRGRISVFPGWGIAVVQNEDAVGMPCCGSFFMRRNHHVIIPVYFGKVNWY